MSVLLFFMVDVLKEGYREKEMADDENWKKFKENSYSPVWALGFAVSCYQSLLFFHMEAHI